jgi:hypothetical protein
MPPGPSGGRKNRRLLKVIILGDSGVGKVGGARKATFAFTCIFVENYLSAMLAKQMRAICCCDAVRTFTEDPMSAKRTLEAVAKGVRRQLCYTLLDYQLIVQLRCQSWRACHKGVQVGHGRTKL